MIAFDALQRPATPNTYLVCTPEICRAAPSDRLAPQFAASVEAVEAALRRLRPDLAFSTTARGRQSAFVAVTRLMRFKDDVDILIAPTADGGSQVAVYSRSRVGYSDLGANRRRVEALLAELEAALTRPAAAPGG